jgi:hypothetical protein
VSCGDPSDDAEHTFFRCDRWEKMRTTLKNAIGENPESIVGILLKYRPNWHAVEQFITSILSTKEKEEQR